MGEIHAWTWTLRSVFDSDSVKRIDVLITFVPECTNPYGMLQTTPNVM